MLEKFNYIFNLELSNNRLVQYHKTWSYPTFWRISGPKEAKMGLNKNQQIMSKYHFWIYQEETVSKILFLVKNYVYGNRYIKKMMIKLQVLTLKAQIIIRIIILVIIIIIYIKNTMSMVEIRAIINHIQILMRMGQMWPK